MPKQYKLVFLNRKIRLSVDKDMEDATAELQKYINEGYQLQQIVACGLDMLVAVLYRET